MCDYCMREWRESAAFVIVKESQRICWKGGPWSYFDMRFDIRRPRCCSVSEITITISIARMS